MARKVFYNKRHKAPKWLQPYIVWGFVFFIAAAFVYFFGIVKFAPTQFAATGSLHRSDDAKNLYLRFQNLTSQWGQNSRERQQVAAALESLKLKGFQKETMSFGACSHYIFEKQSRDASMLVITLPWNSPNGVVLTSASLSIVQAFQNISSGIALILTDSYANCAGNFKLRSALHQRFNGKSVIGFSITPSNDDKINPVAGGYSVSSIQYQSVLVNAPFTGFSAQLMANMFPLFLGEGDALAIDGHNLIKLPYRILGATLEQIEKNLFHSFSRLTLSRASDFEQNSFWLNKSIQLKKGAVFSIVLFLVILTSIPLINRITIKRVKFAPIGGVISTIYFALIPAIVYLLMELLPKHISLAQFTSIFCGGLVVLFFIFKRIEKKFLSIAIDSSSALFMFMVLMFWGIFINPGAIIMLFPMALVYGFIKESSSISSGFFFLLGLIWPIAIFLFAQKDFDFLGLLERRETTPELGWFMMTYLLLLFGSVMSLVNRNTLRTP